MENINFRGIPTSLFLNGPKVGIVTDPQSVSDVIGVATFTGIATATFPDTNFALDGGSVAFKWYFDGSRILDTSEDSNSNAEIVGFSSATGAGSTISISGLTTDDDGKEVYFEAEYVPSAYQTTPPVTAGTARSTGNAFNEPIQSGIGTISVSPIIDIITQPENQSVVTNEDATYTITAQKTPGGGAVNYQWQLNGNDLSDGTTTRTVIGGSDAVITITDASGRAVDTIDFSQVTSYNAFTPEVTYTLVADANVTTKLFAIGGGGGGSDVRSITGSRGGSAEGTFTFVRDQEYKLIVGSGGDRVTAGRPGGGTGGGTRGSSGRGGGGGYTGLFEGSITQANAIIIAGGGGGSTGDPGRGGNGGGLTGDAGSNGGRAGLGGGQTAGGSGKGSSGSGSELQGGNGVNAGAGGGGYYGGGGGNPSGTISDGAGGGGSSFIGGVTDGSTTSGGGVGASFDGSGADGSFRIEFTATTKEVSTTVTGSDTDTLTIVSEGEANGTVRCKLTADNVQESPVFSNTVSYLCVEPKNLLGIETYTYSNATAKISEFDFEKLRNSEAVCISVIDEDEGEGGTRDEINASWNAFRAKYPKRPFWVLSPGQGSPDIRFPPGWDDDPLAYGPVEVRRDGGDPNKRSDWFTITKLDQAPAGTQVSLLVDNSGSMEIATVAASLEYFKQQCRENGIVINGTADTEIIMNPIEHWIDQHNREIANDLNKLLTIDYDTYPGNAVCIYAKDKDLDVEIDMYGGRGYMPEEMDGGEGGYSKIRLTMKKDEEYIITGLFSAVNAPFLYRKASLIACVGAGGNALDSNRTGGAGGGIGVSGEDGASARGAGAGAQAVEAGQGTLAGQFGGAFDGPTLTGGLVSPDESARSDINGGRSIICARGVYWREQGKAPCEDVGTVKFRTPDGTEISNTATIARGYKSGYNIIQTGGDGIGQNNDRGRDRRSGNGGCGFTGGNGGDNRGGGGGSGYTDGSVTVVNTQLGGSDRVNATIVIRLV